MKCAYVPVLLFYRVIHSAVRMGLWRYSWPSRWWLSLRTNHLSYCHESLGVPEHLTSPASDRLTWVTMWWALMRVWFEIWHHISVTWVRLSCFFCFFFNLVKWFISALFCSFWLFLLWSKQNMTQHFKFVQLWGFIVFSLTGKCSKNFLGIKVTQV